MFRCNTAYTLASILILYAYLSIAHAQQQNPYQLLVSPNDSLSLVCITEEEGLIISHNNGETWRQIGKGPDSLGLFYFNVIAWGDGKSEAVLVGGQGPTSGYVLLKYSFQTALWQQIRTPPKLTWIDHLSNATSNAEVVFVSGEGGLWEYQVRQNAWAERTPAGETSVIYTIEDRYRHNRVWSCSTRIVGNIIRGTLWRSDDFADTWKPVFNNTKRSVTTVISNPDNDENIFFCASLVYESTDGGSTFPFTYALDSLIRPILYFAIDWHSETWYAISSVDSIFISTDHGRTWQSNIIRDGDNAGFTNGFILNPTMPKHLYILRTDGLWISTNGGSTWSQNQFKFQSSSSSLLPARDLISIGAPYPLPANSGQFISFPIKSILSGDLRVSLYSINGELITDFTVPLHDYQSFISLNVPQLSRGIYLLNFKLDSFSITKNILITE